MKHEWFRICHGAEEHGYNGGWCNRKMCELPHSICPWFNKEHPPMLMMTTKSKTILAGLRSMYGCYVNHGPDIYRFCVQGKNRSDSIVVIVVSVNFLQKRIFVNYLSPTNEKSFPWIDPLVDPRRGLLSDVLPDMEIKTLRRQCDLLIKDLELVVPF